MGKLSLSHEFLREGWLHAVKAHDDQLIDVTILVGLLSSYEAKEKPEGPRKEGEECEKKVQKENKEGGEEGKTCPWSDVSFERYGQAENEQK